VSTGALAHGAQAHVQTQAQLVYSDYSGAAPRGRAKTNDIVTKQLTIAPGSLARETMLFVYEWVGMILFLSYLLFTNEMRCWDRLEPIE